jgi:hypothetical protein
MQIFQACWCNLNNALYVMLALYYIPEGTHVKVEDLVEELLRPHGSS